MRFVISIASALAADVLLIAARGLSIGVHTEPTLGQALLGCAIAILGVELWLLSVAVVNGSKRKPIGTFVMVALLVPALSLYLIALWDSVYSGIWTRFELPFFVVIVTSAYVSIHVWFSRRGRAEQKVF